MTVDLTYISKASVLDMFGMKLKKSTFVRRVPLYAPLFEHAMLVKSMKSINNTFIVLLALIYQLHIYHASNIITKRNLKDWESKNMGKKPPQKIKKNRKQKQRWKKVTFLNYTWID